MIIVLCFIQDSSDSFESSESNEHSFEHSNVPSQQPNDFGVRISVKNYHSATLDNSRRIGASGAVSPGAVITTAATKPTGQPTASTTKMPAGNPDENPPDNPADNPADNPVGNPADNRTEGPAEDPVENPEETLAEISRRANNQVRAQT